MSNALLQAIELAMLTGVSLLQSFTIMHLARVIRRLGDAQRAAVEVLIGLPR